MGDVFREPHGTHRHPALQLPPPRDDATIAPLWPARAAGAMRRALGWIAASYGLLILVMLLAQLRREGEVHWIGAAIVAAVVVTILVTIVAVAKLVEHRRIRSSLRHGWASPAHVELRTDGRKAPQITVVRAEYTSEGVMRQASFVVRDDQLPLLTDGPAVIHRPSPKTLALLLIAGRLAVLEYRERS